MTTLTDIRDRITRLTLAPGLPPSVWSELCRIDSELRAILGHEPPPEDRMQCTDAKAAPRALVDADVLLLGEQCEHGRYKARCVDCGADPLGAFVTAPNVAEADHAAKAVAAGAVARADGPRPGFKFDRPPADGSRVVAREPAFQRMVDGRIVPDATVDPRLAEAERRAAGVVDEALRSQTIDTLQERAAAVVRRHRELVSLDADEDFRLGELIDRLALVVPAEVISAPRLERAPGSPQETPE